MHQDKFSQWLGEVRSDLQAKGVELSELQTQISQLLSRRDKIQADIAEFQRIERWLANKTGDHSVLDHVTATKPVTATPDPTMPEQGASAPVRHGDIAMSVLVSAGKPLKIGQIIAEMERIGHPLPKPSNVAFNTIYSAMNRRKDTFINLGDGRWGLRSRDKSEETPPLPYRDSQPSLAGE